MTVKRLSLNGSLRKKPPGELHSLGTPAMTGWGLRGQRGDEHNIFWNIFIKTVKLPFISNISRIFIVISPKDKK